MLLTIEANDVSIVVSDEPLKLPKLNPGHVADAYMKSEGSVSRLDPSKLVDSKQRDLADGVKKIDDPIVLKKQKLEV